MFLERYHATQNGLVLISATQASRFAKEVPVILIRSTIRMPGVSVFPETCCLPCYCHTSACPDR